LSAAEFYNLEHTKTLSRSRDLVEVVHTLKQIISIKGWWRPNAYASIWIKRQFGAR